MDVYAFEADAAPNPFFDKDEERQFLMDFYHHLLASFSLFHGTKNCASSRMICITQFQKENRGRLLCQRH